jgi:L-Ala-D/L-Glu epimerase / N-acetyl-D-glutamate racemase
VSTQIWPIAGSFRIAHGSVEKISVIRVEISDSANTGCGECRPYPRYNETPETVSAQILAISEQICSGLTTDELQSLMPAGAARNAVDCALWDLRAKQTKTPVWALLELPKPQPRTTAFTLSINSPEHMAKAALKARKYPILKLKIEGIAGLNSCLAVLNARPDAQLIIDANESLSPDELTTFRTTLSNAPILMIEQPLQADRFDEIDNAENVLPILCADESLHTRADLAKLWDAGYRAVNVKLDKCGGLTEAFTLMRAAKSMGFTIMSGCMVGTSLAMAPMLMLESLADVIDLDGPLLLARDVKNGLKYDDAVVHSPSRKLWG